MEKLSWNVGVEKIEDLVGWLVEDLNHHDFAVITDVSPHFTVVSDEPWWNVSGQWVFNESRALADYSSEGVRGTAVTTLEEWPKRFRLIRKIS